MPIRPENKHRYPKDWPVIRARVLYRARWRCEECRVFNHAWGWRDHLGKFHSVPKGDLHRAGHKPPFDLACHDGRVLRIIEIVLTVAHLDHIPENCADENLRVLCHLPHNRYDAAMRRAGILRRRRALAALGALFEAAA